MTTKSSTKYSMPLNSLKYFVVPKQILCVLYMCPTHFLLFLICILPCKGSVRYDVYNGFLRMWREVLRYLYAYCISQMPWISLFTIIGFQLFQLHLPKWLSHHLQILTFGLFLYLYTSHLFLSSEQFTVLEYCKLKCILPIIYFVPILIWLS